MGAVSPAMSYFWDGLHALEPDTQLGGIFANKPGYHNYRNNLPSWDYSVQLQADKEGSGDFAAALDWTFPEAQSGSYDRISMYAARLLASGQDMNDERGNYLREFYGQADHDQAVEGWDFQALVFVSSDASHLWHIHFSFLRKFADSIEAMDAVLSILRGETVEQWRAGGAAAPAPTPEPVAVLRRPWPSYMPTNEYFGDYNGPDASHGGAPGYERERGDIKAFQQRLVDLGFDPGPVDGIFGPQTIAATTAWQQRDWASTTEYFGQVWIDDWVHMMTY